MANYISYAYYIYYCVFASSCKVADLELQKLDELDCLIQGLLYVDLSLGSMAIASVIFSKSLQP